MLSLSRRAGEGLKIGDAVVFISEVKGDRVRLAIEADRSIDITRTELLQRSEQVQLAGVFPPLKVVASA